MIEKMCIKKCKITHNAKKLRRRCSIILRTRKSHWKTNELTMMMETDVNVCVCVCVCICLLVILEKCPLTLEKTVLKYFSSIGEKETKNLG